MLNKEAIQLKSLSAGEENGKLVVRVAIFNPEQRTLYAYGTPRRILYDNATGKLTLCLHDQHVEEDSVISRHLPQPRFVPLEANKQTEVKLTLPRIVNRVKSASERAGTGPVTEQLRIFEAKEVEVEIAHQDTPFYYNPKIDNAKQLKEWGRTIARAGFKLRPPAERERK